MRSSCCRRTPAVEIARSPQLIHDVSPVSRAIDISLLSIDACLPKTKRYGMVYNRSHEGDRATNGAGLSEVRGRRHMHKFLLALIFLFLTASTAVLAHSGTDQEQQACTRDVQRFCRKLMDQGDLSILVCLKENRPKLSAACRYVLVSHGQ